MVTILIIMTAGVIAGFFIRKHQKLVHVNDRLVLVAILGLLFFMGVAIGKDEKIMNALPKLGIEAFIISLSGVLVSVLVAMLVFHLFFKKHYQRRKENSSQ